MKRLLACLHDELLPVARPDDRGRHQVRARRRGGLRGGGPAAHHHRPDPGARSTRSAWTAGRAEGGWAELGGRVLGTADVAEILRRLRDDRSLRFTARAADRRHGHRRAGAGRRRPATTGSRRTTSPTASIEEIDPVEAGNAALAYYRPPAGGGLRPGAHCVLTSDPQRAFVLRVRGAGLPREHAGPSPADRLRADAHRPAGLPPVPRRRGLRVRRGLGPVQRAACRRDGPVHLGPRRLGMLSFDALRACRLVVDTGMHHLGWSRSAGDGVHVGQHRDRRGPTSTTRSTVTSPGPARRWRT